VNSYDDLHFVVNLAKSIGKELNGVEAAFSLPKSQNLWCNLIKKEL